MRVMVTGATAPLGASIIEALLAAPDVDLVFAVGRERDAALPDDPRVIYRGADLTHPRVVRDLVWGDAREYQIDGVVHGMQHRRAADRGVEIHAQNVESTRELLLACMNHPTIRRIVYRSFSEVYGLHHTPSNLLDEETELDFAPASPQWVRDRVEADLTVCAHFGGTLELAVLRLAEILAPNTGSQLWDYLQSRVCLRPFGFDPIINVLSMQDAVDAIIAAIRSKATGVFNIAGRDTLPLSSAIAESRRANIPVPGPLMSPLYGLRRRIAGFEFRYDMNVRAFHFGGVLDGTRAARELGFEPHIAVEWPRSRWHRLLDRLAAEVEPSDRTMPS